MMKRTILVLAGVMLAGAANAGPQDTKMDALAFMKGTWRGEAKGVGQNGPYTVTQTERVGPMQDGNILVLEGRGYNTTGALEYNAFGIISWNPQTQGYEMRAYNMGQSVTAPLTVKDKVAQWGFAAGPKAKVQFTLDFSAGTWHETGVFIAEGQPPRPTLDMTLTRVGDSDWPAAGAIPAK